MSDLSMITSNVIATSYSPLVLQCDKGTSKWKLTLQLKPEPKITLTGTEPTRDEIIECLRYYSSMPIVIVEILEVIIGVEIARRAK